ncbi:hypothetical protein ACFL08_04940 [Patescibacteria group bacterium]
MPRKALLVLLSAIVGALILTILIFQGNLPPKETIYIGVPVFGFLGALAWWKG